MIIFQNSSFLGKNKISDNSKNMTLNIRDNKKVRNPQQAATCFKSHSLEFDTTEVKEMHFCFLSTDPHLLFKTGTTTGQIPELCVQSCFFLPWAVYCWCWSRRFALGWRSRRWPAPREWSLSFLMLGCWLQTHTDRRKKHKHTHRMQFKQCYNHDQTSVET